MAAQLYKTETGHLWHAGNFAIVTVGLPARGKTYISHKLSRYLRWLGIRAKIFSVGDYRRRFVGSRPHEWFVDPEAASERLKVADMALDDLIKWINVECGQVGIYDASNTESARRESIVDRLTAENIQVLFIEAICDRDEIIEANIRQVKLTSPDYVDMEPADAVKDFLKRIDGFKHTYDTVSNKSHSFIKMVNVGEQMIVNKVRGYLPTRIVYYLMNLHIAPRRIYLVRNGESLNENRARSDAPLSPKGFQFAMLLPTFLDRLRRSQSLNAKLCVWTSPRTRSSRSASNFGVCYSAGGTQIQQKSSLVEFNPGAVDGLSEQQIRESYPEEFENWRLSPYTYRFPRAESYHDLAVRLEGVLLELEREKDDLLIIGHPSVLKCIYAYLLDKPEQAIVDGIEIGVNELIELTPVAYGCRETRYSMNDFA